MTWYTWLKQGRDIGVSAAFLDSLSRALKLDATERRRLFLLAQRHLPPEPMRQLFERWLEEGSEPSARSAGC